MCGRGECGEELASMLDEVCSSGVVGRRQVCCLEANCEPYEREGNNDRLGVGSLGLVLCNQTRQSAMRYLGSRLRLADISAVNEAIGERRSGLFLRCKPM